MVPVIKKPKDCTGRELEEFAGLVIEGGQVSRAGLERRIRQAKLLAFAYENRELAGVAAIKKASWFYVRDVFQKAGEAELAVDFRYELGWAYTRPGFRKQGIHQHLIDLLLDSSSDHNLFGTTGTGNQAVISTITKRGFEKCGSPYSGRDETKQLWVKKTSRKKGLGKWFLKNADAILRGAERSESWNYLVTSFRRKIRTRLTGVQ